VDSLLGYAVTGDNTSGDTNYVIKTTNGGDNWFKLDSIYGDISRVIFLNANTGFICGGGRAGISGGFVSKTTNSGNNWSVLPASVFSIHFDDMCILNQDTMWVVDDNGFDGGVFRSTNGGNNWIQQYGSPSYTPEKIYMYKKNIGFFSTSFQTAMFKTIDGGFNWSKINGEDGFSQVKFIDSLTGWKANGTLMKKTTNGGLNWVNQPLPTPSLGYISGGMYHFSVLNKDTIWGVGGSYQFPNLRTRAILYRTTNSGLNWYFQIPDTNLIKNQGYYGYIQFTNKLIGWAYVSLKGIHTVIGGDTTFLSVHQISSEVPKEFILFQNYPNPFNPITNIRYQITNNSSVILKVYDLLGKEIIVLVNQKQSAGTYEVDFSGKDLSSGIYFYRIEVKSANNYFTDTKKMVLVK